MSPKDEALEIMFRELEEAGEDSIPQFFQIDIFMSWYKILLGQISSVIKALKDIGYPFEVIRSWSIKEPFGCSFSIFIYGFDREEFKVILRRIQQMDHIW